MTTHIDERIDELRAGLAAWQAAQAKAKAARGTADEAERDAHDAYVAWLAVAERQDEQAKKDDLHKETENERN